MGSKIYFLNYWTRPLIPSAILSIVLFSVGLNTYTTASPASLKVLTTSDQAFFMDSITSLLSRIPWLSVGKANAIARMH